MASYTITINLVPEAGGILRIGSEVSGSTNVQEEVATVNLFAAPASGYAFSSYLIDGVEVSTAQSYSFTMPSNDITLTVNFSVVEEPDVTTQDVLYDTSCPRFLIIKNLSERYFSGDLVDFSGTDYTEVEEPIGFDAGVFKLERDSEYHGFNYEFSVDSLSFEIGTVGYSYIKDDLLLSGTDSDLKFVFGYGDVNGLVVNYIGRVDMNSYSESEDGEIVNFDLEELDFDGLLKTNFEIPQDTVPTSDVILFSKVIPKRIEYKIEVPEDVFGLGIGLNNRAWFADAYKTPDEPNPPIENISKTTPIGYCHFNDGRSGDTDFEDFTTLDFQVSDEEPIAISKYVFKAREAGRYDLKIRFWMGLFLVSPANFTDFSFLQVAVVRRNVKTDTNTFLLTENATEVITPTGLLDPDKIIVFTEDLEIGIDINDEVYIYVRINTEDASFPAVGAINSIVAYPFNYDRNIPQIEVIGHTEAPSSELKMVDTYTAINNACKLAIETDYDVLKSDFFSEGGCGELLYLTNGFRLRGLERSIKASPKSLIDMVKNLYCLGMGVEYDIFKRELVRLERVTHFYQNVEILAFESVSNYSKEIDVSAYYNEIEVGFRTYSKQRETDKGFTLDDFHTKHIYQTPVKTNKNKKSIITDLIMSAYMIEIMRRKQFDTEGSKVNSNESNDEDVFGICLSTKTPTTSFTYLSDDIISEDDNYLIVSGSAPSFSLKAGDEVTYTSRAGVVQTRTVSYFNVTSYEIDIITEIITVTTTYIWFTEILSGATSATGNVTIEKLAGSLDTLTAENDENFEAVDNLLSPATTFNLRHTPKRMLLNWARLINGGFFTKSNSDEIKFKQGDGNIEMVSKFANTESCLLGDASRASVFEGGNVAIDEFDLRRYLYLPIKVRFNSPLSFEQLITIKKCLRGQDGSKDYGYITVTNTCGNTEKVYLTSVEYNPIQEEATFEGYLKEIVGIE